jgi:anti-sigma factor RsiW
MNGHVQDWLPAYHDGELHGARLKKVEDHLKGCAACRHDLDQLGKLSALLQAAPGPARQVSAGRFASQVELRLKEPAPRPRWQKALRAGWQLAPLGLLFAWAFAQAVLFLSGLIAGLGGLDALSSIDLIVLQLELALILSVLLWGWVASFWVYQKRRPKYVE